ncbi:YheC/YheD family protein [Caldalkalibacillus salinus]|uniref:YheC/YheD family protein n=1 Tax=Caldalkalibacillus salinus TaxID=2803787 RepID=UPI001923F32E|nr:YheC/YheD family protein [Caldalkalibacillus salinus]
MIGVVFKPAKMKRLVKGKEAHENIHYYKHLALKHKRDILFYSLNMIRKKGMSVKGYQYKHQEQRFKIYLGTLPKVNLLRTIVPSKHYGSLKLLEQERDIMFVNLVEGRNKYRINKYLKNMPQVAAHIPDTERLTGHTLLQYLKSYPKVVIKPINGYFGEKIFVISQHGHEYLVRYTRKGKQYEKRFPTHQLHIFIKTFFSNPSEYMVQEYIPFATYNGKKFDIRTSVQKDKAGHWRMTGIVTRVAGKDRIVTNVAQGGKAVSFQEVHETLQDLHPVLKNEVQVLSLKLAKEIAKLNPTTVDLGLDIAVDKQGKLWFIEANYCDQRYAYREANDLQMWEASYRTPFEYANAIYHKKVGSS